jgi:hypothetical protein
MAAKETSIKYLAISKANTQMVAIIAAASFITIFCLVASKTVFSQISYQARVISASDKANSQLKSNITAFNSLLQSYENFVAPTTNIIGGSVQGSAGNSGDNAKIILDALPSSYDYPALLTSTEKTLTNEGFVITGISGTDQEVAEQGNQSSTDPTPVPMPFAFTVDKTNYNAVAELFDTLQSSIRPIQIDSIDVNYSTGATGQGGDMKMTVAAHSYYQPGISLSITQKEVQ